MQGPWTFGGGPLAVNADFRTCDILLSTLNARYHHSAFGLRYLYANLGELQSRAQILEFIIKKPTDEIVAEILLRQPKIVGLGVYIWNTTQMLAVVQLLKQRAPEVIVVLGGPEVSFEIETQALYSLCDFVFAGESDFSFREFCQAYLERGERPAAKIVRAPLPAIEKVLSPYSYYSDEDIRNRVIYVEASRGCPYKCEYCLSSLDKSVRNFPTDAFLADMQSLIERGARKFKFVDRTFNLSPSISNQILMFFLARVDLGLHLHFELVPDRLPAELKSLIEQFPAGSLQFEIGVQTWSVAVAANVSRRQNYQKICENLNYLKASTGVHTHVDLIIGLPGETWATFRSGFDQLFLLQPDEIQVGVLKRLKGTPIVRHDQVFKMVYDVAPPFQILQNKDLSADQIVQLSQFADFWDAVGNSGRFAQLSAEFRRELLRSGSFVFSEVASTDASSTDASSSEVFSSAFDLYFSLSRFLIEHFQRTHSIHLEDLKNAIKAYLTTKLNWSEEKAEALVPAKAPRGAVLKKLTPGLERQSRKDDVQNRVQNVSKDVSIDLS